MPDMKWTSAELLPARVVVGPLASCACARDNGTRRAATATTESRRAACRRENLVMGPRYTTQRVRQHFRWGNPHNFVPAGGIHQIGGRFAGRCRSFSHSTGLQLSGASPDM